MTLNADGTCNINHVEGPTSLTDMEACSILERMVVLAARCALGDGMPAETVAAILEDMAAAIRDPGSVAEDISPLMIHMA